MLQCVAVWCSVLQCGAVCCSVVQCVAVHYTLSPLTGEIGLTKIVPAKIPEKSDLRVSLERLSILYWVSLKVPLESIKVPLESRNLDFILCIT